MLSIYIRAVGQGAGVKPRPAPTLTLCAIPPLRENLKKSVDNVTLAMKSKIDLRGKMASKESERNSETGVSWKSQWWSFKLPRIQ